MSVGSRGGGTYRRVSIDRLASRRRIAVGRSVWRAALYVLAAVALLVFTMPLIWMVLTALKPHAETYIFPPDFLPHVWRTQNFQDAWTTGNFGQAAVNTLTITSLTVVGTLVSAPLCAFAFARLRFTGRDVIFLCVLASVMLPAQVTLLPLYVVFKDLGWLNTFKPLVVPPFFGGGALNIFLLRQFFKSLPRELDEAALIDGCTMFGIFLRIALPLSKPALAVIGIFTFTAAWTDYLNPLIYLNDPSHFTLALQLSVFSAGMTGGVAHPEWTMAAATIMALPIALVFLFAQRYMVRGVILTGLKG